jgi:hypothetical protein
MSKQGKILEVADRNTFELLFNIRAGADHAMKELEKRLAFIRTQQLRSADADKALTDALSLLQKFHIRLDESLNAGVERTGPDGGPMVWVQDQEDMYCEVELAIRR